MTQDEIDQLIQQYSMYNNPNATSGITSPVRDPNIQTTALPSASPPGPPDTYQSSIVANILNEQDPSKKDEIIKYAISDPTLDQGQKRILQSHYGEQFINNQKQEQLNNFVRQLPDTDLEKAIKDSQLSDDERGKAAFKAAVYARLQLPDLSKRYQELANPRPQFSADMLLDGSRYTVQRDPNGRVTKAWDSLGNMVSGEEFARVSSGAIGSSDGKSGLQTSFTVGYDKYNNVISKSLINGQLVFKNQTTGQLLSRAPEGYRETVDPKDRLAAEAYKNVKEKLQSYNLESQSKGGPILYSADEIERQAVNARDAMYGIPQIASGAGVSVSNQTSPVVQPLNVPGSQPVQSGGVNNPAGIKDIQTGGFRSYATPAEGDMAQHKLLSGNRYGNIPLTAIAPIWAPVGDGNNDPAKYNEALRLMAPNLPWGKTYNQLTPEQQAEFRNAQSRLERGAQKGALMSPTTPTAASVNTGPGSPSDIILRTAQQVADYQIEPPSSNTEEGRRILAEAKRLNPNFSTVDFDTKRDTMKSFATGDRGAQLTNVKNAWVDLSTMESLALALNNGNSQLLNSLGNEFATKTGQPAPTNFDTMKAAVSGEISKVIKSGVASQGEVAQVEKTLSSANSPAQLLGALGLLKEIIVGRGKGLKDVYVGNGGSTDKFNNVLINDKSLSTAIIQHQVNMSPETLKKAKMILEARKKAQQKE